MTKPSHRTLTVRKRFSYHCRAEVVRLGRFSPVKLIVALRRGNRGGDDEPIARCHNRRSRRDLDVSASTRTATAGPSYRAVRYPLPNRVSRLTKRPSRTINARDFSGIDGQRRCASRVTGEMNRRGTLDTARPLRPRNDNGRANRPDLAAKRLPTTDEPRSTNPPNSGRETPPKTPTNLPTPRGSLASRASQTRHRTGHQQPTKAR